MKFHAAAKTDDLMLGLRDRAFGIRADLHHRRVVRREEWPDPPPLSTPSEGPGGLSGILFGEGTRDGWGLAQACGWHCVHVRDSRRQDIAGLPDWIAIRETVIYVELKRQRDELTPAQVDMAARLIAAGAHYYLIRPSDWAAIGAVLIGGPK